MADAAEFVVAMIDKVSGPARAAARQIDALRKKFQQASVAAVQTQKAQSNARRIMGDFKRGFVGKNPFEGKDASFLGEKTKDAIKGATGKVVQAGKYALLGLGAAGAAAGAMIVKGTLHMANFAETTQMAFHALTGSQAGADKAWETSLRLSKQLGQGVEETATSMKHLLAMQFSLGEAEEMVKISADLKAVTGDAHSAERALTAITQIKAKGKLQSEELVGQLAEAGVSTTLVYEELSKIMGKSGDQVRKMLSQGQIGADVGIQAIKAAILRKTHSSEAGTAGTNYAQTTFSGLMGQLKNAPQFLFVKLAEQVKANLDKFRPAVQKIIDAIDRIQGDQMAKFVGNVLQFAERLVPLALAFAEGFGEGFAEINAAMGAVDPAVTSLETARSIGKGIAKVFEWIFNIAEKIGKAVAWLDGHDLLGATLTSALAILATMRAIVAISGTAAALKGLGGLLTRAAPAVVPTVAPVVAPVAAPLAANAGMGALAGTLGLGGAGALMGGGLALAGLSYYFREELANFGLSFIDRAEAVSKERGLGTTPTDTLTGLQRAAANPNRTNNVRMESNVVINGADKDGKDIAREVHEGQRGMLEQFFQSQALEQGAM